MKGNKKVLLLLLNVLVVLGFCDEVYRDKIFDIEFYADGLLNKRIFFRLKSILKLMILPQPVCF